MDHTSTPLHEHLERERAVNRRWRMALDHPPETPLAPFLYECQRPTRSRGPVRKKTTERSNSPIRIRPARKLRRIVAGLGGVLVTLQLVAPGLVDTSVLAAIRSIVPERVIAPLDAARTCAQRVAVLDRNGISLGTLSLDNDCPPSRLHRGTTMSEVQANALAPWIELVEGWHGVGRGTLAGFDLRGPLRALYSLATGGPRVGGSNALQSGVKNLSERPGALGWSEKLRFVALTLAYTAHRLDTGPARDAFALETLPCARGEPGAGARFGAPVAGGLCGPILFGTNDLAALDPARACLLAASYRDQARIVGQNAPAEVVARARRINERIRTRARHKCLDAALEGGMIDLREHAQAVAHLSQLPFPATFEMPASAPARRAASTLRGPTHFLAATPKTPILRTTLDVGLQRHVEDTTADRFAGEDVLVAVVERSPNGFLVLRAIQENRPGLLKGPPSGTPHRSVGSLAKALFLPLVVEAGVTAPCPRRMNGLHDPDGGTGVATCGLETGIPLATVLARSLNLSYAEALSAVDPDRLRAYARMIGMTVSTAAPLRHGATLGYAVPVAPNDVMRAAALILSGGPTSTPTMFPRVSAQRLDPASLGLSTRTLTRSAILLRAPIEHPRGTLRSTTINLPGCTLFGKTGTTDSTVTDAVRDRLALVAAQCGQRTVLVLALVGSPRMERPLRGVSAHDVNAVAFSALRAAIQSSLSTPNQE